MKDSMRINSSFLLIVVILISSTSLFPNHIFKTKYLKMQLDEIGNIISMLDIENNKEYLFRDQPPPLMTIRKAGELEKPAQLVYDSLNQKISLQYEKSKVKMELQVMVKPTHICFELVSVTPNDKTIELIIWGPYPTTIHETIGETIGIVRNQSFALGIQALNVKTLGGYPSLENDVMPSYNIFSGPNYKDIDEKDRTKKLFRGETAKPMDFGSVLQAYCRNRNVDRVISNWDHDHYFVPAYEDGGIMGSKIALFGCPENLVLETLGKIELSEGLPHPILDSVWGKISETATDSYLISDFGEDNIDILLGYTKKAGLKYLYHGNPFETWGHFKLKQNYFPEGVKSLQAMVEKADREGIRLGIHTLSNFITANDSYVTPFPDKRLAMVGSSILLQSIDDTTKEIIIEDPKFFNQMRNNTLHAVVIGEEIIRYKDVSDTKPWRLVNCVRGVYGTNKSNHQAGDKISKLIDHPYKVFLSNIQLQDEIAINIANLFNETGLKQISFDGLEGCWSTGMGQYARTVFVKKWYDHLSDDLRGSVITDASNPGHYFWHIYTRMNWGEPWYAGFRESQTQYRLKNQEYFQRNLMPAMLGWFKLTPQTSIQDIEWLLARAAGFHAGFSLVANLDVFKQNAKISEILAAIQEWETVRHAHVFSEDQKKRMRNVKNEFHLARSEDENWLLYPYYVSNGNKHENKEKQPGEPNSTSISINNPYQKQPLQFCLRLASEDKISEVSGMSFEMDHFKRIEIPGSLRINQILIYNGNNEINVYDDTWNIIETRSIDPKTLMVARGEHVVDFDCKFNKDSNCVVIIELRTIGEPETVNKK